MLGGWRLRPLGYALGGGSVSSSRLALLFLRWSATGRTRN